MNPDGMLEAFAAARGLPRFLWRGTESMVAWGKRAVIETQGPRRFDLAEKAMEFGEVPWVGGFGFLGDPSPGWDAFGAMQWWQPAGGIVWNPEGAPFGWMPKPEPAPPCGTPNPLILGRAGWDGAMARASTVLASGQAAKVVLARAEAAPACDIERVLARLLQEPGTLYVVEPVPGIALVGLSPERLVRVEGLGLETEALAGTAGPGQANEKLQREHAWVVKHIEDALSGLGLQSSHAPSDSRLAGNLRHTHTAFRASGPTTVLQAAKALHPTPAVGTYPASAVDAVRACDGLDRGWYAGGVGFIRDASHGEIAVSIRCALLSPTGAWRFAGAGIVAGSLPEAEWQETEAKLQRMREAMA